MKRKGSAHTGKPKIPSQQDCFRPYVGEKVHIDIIGTSVATTLKVNGKVVADLQPQTLYFNEGKDKMTRVSTLVFPLQQAGTFKSKVSQFEVRR